MIEIVSGWLDLTGPQPEVTEQYLASWLCVHARSNGLPQREYDAIIARGLARLHLHAVECQEDAPRAPALHAEEEEDGNVYDD